VDRGESIFGLGCEDIIAAFAAESLGFLKVFCSASVGRFDPVAVELDMLQSVVVCCSMLQYVAVDRKNGAQATTHVYIYTYISVEL